LTDKQLADDEGRADHWRRQLANNGAPNAGPNHFVVDWQLPIDRPERNPFGYLVLRSALVGPARDQATGGIPFLT
jgi:hypothetical protein